LRQLECGGVALRFGTGDRVGKIDDLVNGIDRFTFAATATDIKHAGDELIPEAVGVGEALKFAFPAGDKCGNTNGLTAVTADNSAISFRYY